MGCLTRHTRFASLCIELGDAWKATTELLLAKHLIPRTGGARNDENDKDVQRRAAANNKAEKHFGFEVVLLVSRPTQSRIRECRAA